LAQSERAPLFSLLFTGNYQRRTIPQPQEYSIVGGTTNKKQREDDDTELFGGKNAETPDERYAT
jgi:hypothetical protein